MRLGLSEALCYNCNHTFPVAFPSYLTPTSPFEIFSPAHQKPYFSANRGSMWTSLLIKIRVEQAQVQIPVEMLLDIFQYLPTCDIKSVEQVSKGFNLTGSPYLVRSL